MNELPISDVKKYVNSCTNKVDVRLVEEICKERLEELDKQVKTKMYLIQFDYGYDSIWYTKEDAFKELNRLSKHILDNEQEFGDDYIKGDYMPKILIRYYPPEEADELYESWNPSEIG